MASGFFESGYGNDSRPRSGRAGAGFHAHARRASGRRPTPADMAHQGKMSSLLVDAWFFWTTVPGSVKNPR
jgi:hypothetical protein